MDSLLFIATLPVVLIGYYIYAKDRNKEPKSLLFKLLLGGIGSVFLVFILNDIIGLFIPNFDKMLESKDTLTLFIASIFGVGLVEEISKWIFAYKISYNNKEFDELYDMIIYCVFVALGFALFENLMYVLVGGLSVGITRAFLAVPGHACDGVFMGYFLGLAKYYDLNKNPSMRNKNIALSIIVPTLMHGVYDFLLLTENLMFILIFFVLVILMYIFTVKKVNAVAAIDHNFYRKKRYCTNCGHEVSDNFCGNCGQKVI
ncbi:MAG: PrsW family intramembrane metalloprotease [Bacilli bacterium]|nr:PrsW family intramembrane metalloprotease [Bacilli bacterium]